MYARATKKVKATAISSETLHKTIARHYIGRHFCEDCMHNNDTSCISVFYERPGPPRCVKILSCIRAPKYGVKFKAMNCELHVVVALPGTCVVVPSTRYKFLDCTIVVEFYDIRPIVCILQPCARKHIVPLIYETGLPPRTKTCTRSTTVRVPGTEVQYSASKENRSKTLVTHEHRTQLSWVRERRAEFVSSDEAHKITNK